MANAAINAAIMAAAAKAEQDRKELFARLQDAGATSARKAIQLSDLDKDDQAVLDHHVKSGAVREAGGSRYWLDEEAYAAAKAAGGRLAIIFLLFLLSAGLSLWALLAL